MAELKYGNEPTMHRNLRFDSKFESQVAMILEEHLTKGTLTEVRTHVKCELWAEGEHIIDYKVDFRCEHRDGRVIWVEAKGFETADWRIKRNIMEKIYVKNHPGEEYLVVKKNNFSGRNRFDKDW